MASAIKKTISLPADLARETEALARAEGKTLSAVIQDALRRARIERQLQELRGMQCALAGHGEAIVTGDHGLLSLREYEGVRVISVRDYLARS